MSSPLPLFNAKLSLPRERDIFSAILNTITHVGLLHYPDNITASRVYDAAARERCRTTVFSGVASKIGRGGDMLPRYRAAQSHWASFAFGVIALALGIIFQRGRVLGYCTPQPASIPEIKKGDCLNERTPSQEDTHTARTSKEKNNDNCDYNWETRSPWYINATKQNQGARRKRCTSGVYMNIINFESHKLHRR